MSDAYVREKAAVAAHCLAVSSADVQTRIADAWLSALGSLAREDLGRYSAEAQDAFERVRSKLAAVPAEGSRSSAQMSSLALSDDDAVEVARDIMVFHAEVMPV